MPQRRYLQLFICAGHLCIKGAEDLESMNVGTDKSFQRLSQQASSEHLTSIISQALNYFSLSPSCLLLFFLELYSGFLFIPLLSLCLESSL